MAKRSWLVAWAAAAIACVAGLLFTDVPWRNDRVTLLLGRHAEYAPFVLPLLLAWPAWRSRRRWGSAHDLIRRSAAWAKLDPKADAIAAGLVALVAGWMTWTTGEASGLDEAGRPLPPAYHDEFSYLFQARTFLDGGVTADGFPARPALFDQMHVLSGDRMASRYFPGTGAWMTPFVAVGRPWLGHQVAHVLVAVLLFFAGREVGGRACGMTAGLLFGLSPGYAIFSTLLVAHHPTLVGLATFLLGYLVWRRTGRNGPLWWAGTGLAFAMLCRPMTAAGFALPFGVDFVIRLAGLPRGGPGKSRAFRVGRAVLSLALPLAMGFAAMLAYNAGVTGDPLLSPYQVYNDLHTPRHVYGFNNADRGEAALAAGAADTARRITAYDRWAANLTPGLAMTNAGRRVEASLRLTLGVVPLAFVGAWLLASWRTRPAPHRLLGLSILSLHAVHVPYWFVGIMNWHYVMESGVCWLLLTGACLVELARSGRDLAAAVFAGALATAAILNVVSMPPYWLGEADGLVAEVYFPRARYGEFYRGVEEATEGRPSVVLVRPDASDVATDYVANAPGLAAPILYARLRPDESVSDAAALFPARDVWLFDPAAGRFEIVRRSSR